MTRERGNLGEFSAEKNKGWSNEKMGFQNGVDFVGENSADRVKIIGGFDERGFRSGNSGFQELTLSYLCESSKLGISEKDISGKTLLNSLENLSGNYKGKEVVVPENRNEDDNNMWVERDFLQLNGNKGNPSKREFEDVESAGENRKKKPKDESLDLSLALPEVSHFMAGSNRVQNEDLPMPTMNVQSIGRPAMSVQSEGPSFNNRQTTFSLSYSYSHPVSHNPSCSLTRNSTENYEYSMGSHRRDCDQIWNCGEGTNGSVHSRFRPIGDGTVALSNHTGGGGLMMGNRSGFFRDPCIDSIHRTANLENISFPSELPARPRIDGQSGDSRWKDSENLNGLEDFDARKVHKISRPERIVREIVSESIPVMAQIIQELTDETINAAKEYLKNVISSPERKDELVDIKMKLERRADLTHGTLSKCQKSQLEILVAVKMELGVFLNGKLPAAELVEIFLLERCRNVSCKRLLPVDDCECKICSTKKGFCSECMCPICLKFDSANKTCSWVGCDVCSHWCHAACGLQRNIIRPEGTTGMQFNCLGCGHASEMFGFIKEVFHSCAQHWSVDTLIKELDCVREIFRGSGDRKGKELHFKANEMLGKLQNNLSTASDVCNHISQFFFYADGLSDLGSSSLPSVFNNQQNFDRGASSFPPSNSLTPKASLDNMNNNLVEDEWSVKPAKKNTFDSLDSLVRIKEAEARMFQDRADEAQRDAESFRQLMRMKTEKLEEEYSEKFAKLCLPETEESQRKKQMELKELENLHCDYYKMKIRMQSEISGLLKRMEGTKQQIV